ncbi:MFS transporter [Actinomadura rupiterrae]|uniref:MFS transporter n=1 Tax=Actinomadura rupiterrae TaxID=559627 RepID=UPI0027E244C8|nr:MFS transporter [Actinomadura rupiterrae]
MSTTASAPARPVRPALVLAICCLSLLIVGLDNTIVTIALPRMRADLHAPLSLSQWTVDSYQLVLGALLLTAGSLADRWGRRRILQSGLAIFTLASLLCSMVPNAQCLVASRVLQAIGGSMMNPVAMAIVSQVFPDPDRRARAFGIWSGVYGLSMALGPILGGILVGTIGWRSIFWINVPIGLLAIGLAARYVPESRGDRPRRADLVGQLLVVTVLTTLTYAIINGRTQGWASPSILGLIVLALVCGAGLIVWESHHPEPLIDPRFFGSLPFAGAVAMALVGMAAAGGYLWVMTFYLQDARGLSATIAGLLMLPLALTVLLVAPLSGRLAARYGARMPLAISGAALMVAALLLTVLSADTPAWLLLASFLCFGLGFGMLNAPITATAVSGMPLSQAGVASAVASTGRQVGQALGVAIVGAVVVAHLSTDPRASLPAASRPGWWIIAAGGAMGVLIAFLATGKVAHRTADRTAARLLSSHQATPLAPGMAAPPEQVIAPSRLPAAGTADALGGPVRPDGNGQAAGV